MPNRAVWWEKGPQQKEARIRGSYGGAWGPIEGSKWGVVEILSEASEELTKASVLGFSREIETTGYVCTERNLF